MGELDSSGIYSDFERLYFDGIETARIALRQGKRHGGHSEVSRSDFWAVLRDDRHLGLFQTDGPLLPNAQPMSLMKVYNANKRSILQSSFQVKQLITG